MSPISVPSANLYAAFEVCGRTWTIGLSAIPGRLLVTLSFPLASRYGLSLTPSRITLRVSSQQAFAGPSISFAGIAQNRQRSRRHSPSWSSRNTTKKKRLVSRRARKDDVSQSSLISCLNSNGGKDIACSMCPLLLTRQTRTLIPALTNSSAALLLIPSIR